MPVSRILYPGKPERLSFIWDAVRTDASRCQPTNIRRAAVKRLLIWHFSAQGLPLYIVASVYRSLLHYFFTLASHKYGGYFLWHCLSPRFRDAYPLGSALLCAVRTFLQYCYRR